MLKQNNLKGDSLEIRHPKYEVPQCTRIYSFCSKRRGGLVQRVWKGRHCSKQTSADFEGTYGSKMFPDINVASNSTELPFTSNRMHRILLPSSVRDQFLFEILSPLEYATIPNTKKAYLAYVIFGRINVTNTVDKFKLEVDVEYERGPDSQVIG